ncbi:MAG TPA: hypothetical protein VJ903_01135, partial [Clostridia bacterium]|nr:hypothetical protein [Clostridia bacterium]
MKNIGYKGVICSILLFLMLACLYACSSVLLTVDFVVDGEIYHTIYVKNGDEIPFPKQPGK